MKTLIAIATLLVVAFMFGQCAGHYANHKLEQNNPFEKRLTVEVQQ
jgi:hypothetical protein